jgi:hypothetical protein
VVWGQQVIIKNRPGGGIVGNRAMLGEQPDGIRCGAGVDLHHPAGTERQAAVRR